MYLLFLNKTLITGKLDFLALGTSRVGSNDVLGSCERMSSGNLSFSVFERF